MRRWLLPVILMVLLCESPAVLQADDPAFTVLPATQVVHLDHLCSRDGPGVISGGWQPTPSQIAKAEASLPSFVMANGRPKGPLGYRQYLGVVIGGRRLIYLNVFPRWLVERRPRDWRTAFVRVCDGGDGFWGAVYDPETLRFSSPEFNGPY